MSELYYLPQYKQTYLEVAGGINSTVTTDIKLNDVTGVDITKPGIICVDWANPIDTTTYEYITYTSIDANNELVGATRGEEGVTAKSHNNGAVIGFVVSKSHINNANDRIKGLETGSSVYAADAGSTDAYAITLSPVPSAYATGMVVRFKANTINTGAATLNVNALGAKTIKKNYNTDLSDGDIVANQLVTVIYDGTNFQLISPTSPSSSWTVLTDAATVDIDVSLNTKYQLTLGGNRILTISNTITGKLFLLRLIQDGTGSRTVTWFNKASTFAEGDVNVTDNIITVARDIPTTTPIKFSSTTTVPAGLTAGTVYYAINQSATTIKVAASVANAQAGTAIDITDDGTGTHTITTEIRWTANTAPTLTTGKYRVDVFGIIIKDSTAGIFEGYTVGQDV